MLREFSEDTIAAISTPLGEGGIGIVRLSGPRAVAIADRIFKPRGKTPLAGQKNFVASLGRVVDPAGGKTVDEALALVMRAPKSYTREDVVEIHAHGSNVSLRAILDIAIHEGARLAAPGEFTQRAFLNGRIDLLQAEAVLDVIQSKTDLGRRWAASRLEGNLSANIARLKNELVETLSHLEAAVDFPEDFPDTAAQAEIAATLEHAAAEIRGWLKGSEISLLVKHGLQVVIAGRPNVGKSSLLNRLCGTNRVIVTPYPGTTRDLVEETASIRGFPLRFWDTAGIQDTDNPIEKEGIERTQKALGGADILLLVLDASLPFSEEDKKLLQQTAQNKRILVANKSDLPRKLDLKKVAVFAGSEPLLISCMEEKGTELLENEIFRLITQGSAEIPDESIIGSLRQKELLEKTADCVEQARQACRSGSSPEFAAADLRLALNHLGALVGEVLTDDILEVLFKRFCIGK